MAAQQDSTSSSSNARLWFWLGLGSVLAAALVHAYLTNTHLQLKFGVGTKDSLCNFNETFSCDAAAASRFSEFLGVPIALWGAITNAVLFFLAAMFPFTEDESKPIARKNILIFSGFIAIVSIVMGIISLTVLTQYCPFCILTYILSFTAFAGFYKGLQLPAVVKSPISGTRYGIGAAKPLIFSAIAILLGGFIASGGLHRGYVPNQTEFEGTIRSYIQEWQSNPASSIEPVAPMIKGNPDPNAKMTIVEFADFRCGHCAHAAPVLSAFVRSHPDVRLIFQAWPLDGECNTAISHSNGVSCALARAVVCAEKQGKGWSAHDYIFENQAEFGSMESVKKKLADMSQKFSLNQSDLMTCLDSEDTKKAVAAAASVGTRLNIKGTPTIFVNGRQLPGGQTIPVLQEAYKAIHAQ